MNVNYTPSLTEQIKHRNDQKIALANHPVVIWLQRSHGYVENIDPTTRQTTGVPQQFLHDEATGTLTILSRAQWVSDPIEIHVDSWRT